MQGIVSNEPLKGIVTVVQNDTLNVRRGPGANFEIVRSLNPGAQVNIFAIQNNWYQISNTEEWVNGKFITIA